MKQEGTLGFSIFRYESSCDNDNHSTGIYVKALIREPAISDGQIQVGDQILQVINTRLYQSCHTYDVTSFLSPTDKILYNSIK